MRGDRLFHFYLGGTVAWIDIAELAFFASLVVRTNDWSRCIEVFRDMYDFPKARKTKTEVVPSGGIEIVGYFADCLTQHSGIDSHDVSEIEIVTQRSCLIFDETVCIEICAVSVRSEEIGIDDCCTRVIKDLLHSGSSGGGESDSMVCKCYDYRPVGRVVGM